MIDPKTIKVAIYIRVGNKDQLNIATENQKCVIEEYLKKKGDCHITDYYIDNGYSGMNFKRPMFEKMCNDIKKNIVNTIAVYDYSRISRNMVDLFEFYDHHLKSRNIKLISVLDDNDFNGMRNRIEKIIPLKMKNRRDYYGRQKEQAKFIRY